MFGQKAIALHKTQRGKRLDRIVKISLIGCLALLLALFLVSASDVRGETLKSPPLPAINNHCLALALPKGWKIVRQDDVFRWKTASYNCDITHPHEKTISIEILNYDTIRAQMHGDLTGKPFTTSSGLHGVIHRLSFVPGQTDWYFAIPNKATGDVLIIRLVGLTGTSKAQRTFADRVFKAARFVTAPET
jgi:hypothetical protein